MVVQHLQKPFFEMIIFPLRTFEGFFILGFEFIFFQQPHIFCLLDESVSDEVFKVAGVALVIFAKLIKFAREDVFIQLDCLFAKYTFLRPVFPKGSHL